MASLDAHQIKKNYEDNLKAAEHYEELVHVLNSTILYDVTLPFLYEVFQSGRFRGSKLLDIGSGPTVHNIASASAHFPSIVISDFVEDNRQELHRWLKGESKLDWTEFFNKVAKLEGYEQNLAEGRQILESRVRRSIQCITKCDLLAENVLTQDQSAEPDTSPPYDLVISLWCFEAVAPSVDYYREMMKKVSQLLRDGGGLILSGFLDCGMWPTGDKQHYHLKISAEQVTKALVDAGFEDIDFRQHKRENLGDYCLYESLFCLAAMKKPFGE